MAVNSASRWALAAVLAATLLACHPAWQGWFQDDDLDNLAWAASGNPWHYARTLLSPVFTRDTFRPTGHLVYHFVARLAGENFLWYLGALQLFHLLTIALLFALLRRLGASVAASAGAAALFAIHPACFAAGWRPMYYFDVLCALFCLLSLACWIRRRWLLAFASFWIAYRAKELAVMLPLVLAAWEFLLGQRRWKPLVPFFLVSLSFGSQAVWANRVTNDPYTLRPGLGVLAECLSFYSRQLFFPYSALLVTALAALLRDRRAWFGITLFWAMLAPMLILPGRLAGVYLYASLAGVAVLAAVLLDHPRLRLPGWIFVAAWIACSCSRLIPYEARELRIAADNRRFVRASTATLLAHPEIHYYLFEGRPAGFAPWGVGGGLTFVARNRKLSNDPYLAESSSEIDTAVTAARVPLVLLAWDPELGRAATLVRTAETKPWPYVPMRPLSPVWQLGKGWFPLEEHFRWIAPHAEARLARPAAARWFEIVADATDPADSGYQQWTLRVFIDGHPLEPVPIPKAGLRTLRWTPPPSSSDTAEVSIDFDPPYHPPRDSRTLAMQVHGFGFKE